MKVQLENLSTTFKEYKNWGKEYFINWTYEKPLLISPSTNSKVDQLQKIMHKMIQHFVKNYDTYEDLMPLDTQSKRVLNFFKHKDYQVGSYRTDFVIDKKHQFKLIEITCRFALNGFWLTGFLNNMAKDYGMQNKIEYQDQYEKFLDFLDKKLKGRNLVILSHKGKGEESRHYQKILADAGYSIKKVYVENIETELANTKNKVFITEFNQENYFELSDKVLTQLAKVEILNDLRTVFLVHDKRFFSILGNKTIREAVLSSEEITLFDEFYIPTYSYGAAAEKWKLAKENKDNWIIKHKHLGKSEKIFAGLVTDETIWQKLFESDEIKDMILQPFISQPTFKGKIKKTSYEDYVVGTMLFFDDNYFGLGLFRASSHPVTNVVDDRKLMHLHITDTLNSNSYDIL